VIVLNERHATPNGGFKLLMVETLKEKTTIIAKDLRLKNKHIGDLGLNNVHHEYLAEKWG